MLLCLIWHVCSAFIVTAQWLLCASWRAWAFLGIESNCLGCIAAKDCFMGDSGYQLPYVLSWKKIIGLVLLVHQLVLLPGKGEKV